MELLPARGRPVSQSVKAGWPSLLRRASPAVPISLHVEYLPKGTVKQNVDALRSDLGTLRRLLASRR